MSDTTPESLNLRDVVARIDRNQAETAKLLAEQPKMLADQSKLLAEHRKLNAEAVKLGRDAMVIPWQIAATFMVAGGTLVSATIAQRRQLARHLRDNPSLQACQDEAMADAYGDAVLRAERETDLPRDEFPWTCPWRMDQVLDDGYWPEPA